MRLLYLYPEEWTGRRAREVHTLSTCVALAEVGLNVTLVTAGGARKLNRQLYDMTGKVVVPDLNLVALSRRVGPVRSSTVFRIHFLNWLQTQAPFDWVYIIHLKAAAMLKRTHAPYAYETNEIFAQTPQKNAARQSKLHELERHVLSGATLRVATSSALATALGTWFAVPNDFVIIPNAGLPPLEKSVGSPNGPFVYAGSLFDWKGLDLVIHAARAAQVPLKIIGGTKREWQKLGKRIDTTGVEWIAQVPVTELPKALTGARAGLVPTQPEAPSGRYACPMKLFDYARCGLPVLSATLPSLQSLHVGMWCRQIATPSPETWAEAFRNFRYNTTEAEAALAWGNEHTWANRAELLITALRKKRVAVAAS